MINDINNFYFYFNVQKNKIDNNSNNIAFYSKKKEKEYSLILNKHYGELKNIYKQKKHEKYLITEKNFISKKSRTMYKKYNYLTNLNYSDFVKNLNFLKKKKIN